MQVKKILRKLKRLDISKLEKDIIYDSVDLNTINNTETGSFNISCTNKPFEGTGGIIETIKMSENYAVQKAINASNGDNYQRLKIGGTWQPWIANIETITNENGTAIKFQDGTMIQYVYMEVTDQAIDSAYGSLYNGLRVWTFPLPFVGTRPSVSCTQFQWGNGASWGSVRGASATTATLRGTDISSRSAGTTTSISAIAIRKMEIKEMKERNKWKL